MCTALSVPGLLAEMTSAMLTIMLISAAIAIAPALLNTTVRIPLPLTRTEEDIRAAAERA